MFNHFQKLKMNADDLEKVLGGKSLEWISKPNNNDWVGDLLFNEAKTKGEQPFIPLKKIKSEHKKNIFKLTFEPAL